jgi:hypothetical protein
MFMQRVACFPTGALLHQGCLYFCQSMINVGMNSLMARRKRW